MRKTLLVAAGAAAFATPGVALAGEPYIGLSAGVSLPSDSSNEGETTREILATDDFDAIPNGTDLAWDTEFDTGFTINGQVGYAFDNGFRVELEGAYSQYDVDSHSGVNVGGANIDDVNVGVLLRTPADLTDATVGSALADGQGQVETFGLFANVAYDINTGTGFKPYVGAGAGYQWVDVEFIPSGVPVASDDDGAFAYQLFAGASVNVLPRAELFGQVTYRANFEDADVPLGILTFPATLGVESEQTLITAGVRFRL